MTDQVFGRASGSQLRRATFAILRRDRRGFAAVLAWGIGAAGLAVAPPWIVGRIVDAVTRDAPLSEIDLLGIALLVLALLQFVATRFAHYVSARFGQRVAGSLRSQLIRRVLALPARVVERLDRGDLVVRATSDVTAVAGILRGALVDIVVCGFQVVLTVVALLVLSPLLAGVGLIFLAGIPIVTRWYLRLASAAYLQQATANGRVAESLASTVAGARTIELEGLQEVRRADADAAIASARFSTLATLRLRSVLFPVVDTSYVLPVVALLIAGGVMYSEGLVSLGSLIAALLLFRQLAAPLDAILLWVEGIQSAIGSFSRIEGLATHAPTEADDATEPAGERVILDGVGFHYGSGDFALRAVNLELDPGERLVVVGRSGAGKSTLGRVIAGLEAPTIGAATLGGVAIATIRADHLRSHVVFLDQDAHVFRDTLRSNLLLADPTAGDAQLRGALDAVHADWFDDLPDGLDSELHHKRTLSGAEAQQVALARVILADPHTVVLDEATALLDPTTARATERALQTLLIGRTVVTIAHRLTAAYDAERVIVMEHGEILEQGSHHQLVEADGPYSELWRAWRA